MNREQSALLAILRHGIDPNVPLPGMNDCDWALVFREGIYQAVSLFVCDALAGVKEHLPKDLQEEISRHSMTRVAANITVMRNQRNLADILGEEPYVILKGEAAAAYYPNPDLRILGDVDFLVAKERFQDLHRKFTEMGFISPDHQIGHHISYRTPGGVLEMHSDPPGIPGGKQEKPVREYLFPIYSTIQKRESFFGSFPAPEDRLHGLILLMHMQHHMLSEGIGLRHLMDWGCYVKATEGAAFWEESLLPLLKKAGLFRYCAVMTKTSALYLGTPCPDWAQGIEEDLCREVLEDIFAGGNFGRKDTTRAASAHMVSDSGKSGTKRSKLGNLLMILYRAVRERHPVVEKYPVLYLVFYPIRAVRYLFLMLIGKRGSLIKAVPQATQRRELYRKLRIFEEE